MVAEGYVDVGSLEASPDAAGDTWTALPDAEARWTVSYGDTRDPYTPPQADPDRLLVAGLFAGGRIQYRETYTQVAAPVIPALVGPAFLDRTAASVGDTLGASVFGIPVQLELVGTVDSFPSLDARSAVRPRGRARAGPRPSRGRGDHRRHGRVVAGRRARHVGHDRRDRRRRAHPRRERRGRRGGPRRPRQRTRSASGSSASSGSARWPRSCSPRSGSSSARPCQPRSGSASSRCSRRSASRHASSSRGCRWRASRCSSWASWRAWGSGSCSRGSRCRSRRSRRAARRPSRPRSSSCRSTALVPILALALVLVAATMVIVRRQLPAARTSAVLRARDE